MTITKDFLEVCLDLGDFETTYEKLCALTPAVEGLSDPVLRLWDVARPRAQIMPASTQFHGAWPGGFDDHVNDLLLYCVANSDLYQSPLSLQQWAVTVLLHDWEKLWKYRYDHVKGFVYRDCGKSGWGFSITPTFRIGAWLKWSGVTVAPEMLNALTMSEGGWSQEARTSRDADTSGTAALLHAADMFSAKVRRNSPSKWARRTYPVIENKCSATLVEFQERMTKVERENPVERVLWPS